MATLPGCTGQVLPHALCRHVSAHEGSALLHSAYNPKREAEQAVANSDFAGCRAAVFFGFGLGYAVEAYEIGRAHV